VRRFSTIFFSVLTLVVLIGLIGPAGGAQEQPAEEDSPSFGTTQNGEKSAPDRIIVKLKEGAPSGALEELNSRNGARTEKQIAPRLVPRLHVVKLPPGLTIREAVGRYGASQHVEYAEPDFLRSADDHTPTDEYYTNGSLWALKNTGQNSGTNDADIDAGADANAAGAWHTTTGSPNTVVAVIDTGVQRDHPDLDGNTWTNPNDPLDGIDNDGNDKTDDTYGWDFYHDDGTVFDARDGDEHGTHVAGTIAAEADNTDVDVGGVNGQGGVAGVNWDAQIMVLKFLGPNGGFTSDAIDAVQYASDHNVKISNNSWGGGGYSQALYDVINNSGILFVASAGNDGANTDTSPHYPSSYQLDNVVSVAATNRNDELASWSNYGATSVDLMAPGVSILSTVPNNTYASYSGTSMAAPHVTGTAALIKSHDPALDALGIKDYLLQGGDKKSAFGGKSAAGSRANANGAVTGNTRLNLEATPRTPVFDPTSGSAATTFSVKLTSSSGGAISGEQVKLEKRVVGGTSYSQVGTCTTDTNGSCPFDNILLDKYAVYRASYAGRAADGTNPSQSPSEAYRRVPVKVFVSDVTVTPLEFTEGGNVTFSGQVKPNHYRQGSVKLTIYRSSDNLVAATKSAKLNSSSEYSLTTRWRERGTFLVEATFIPSGSHIDHQGNTSNKSSSFFTVTPR
jgi:thermitase